MANDFANTLMLVCGAVLCGFLTASVFSYAAHSLLLIVTDTAAGVDEVRWPSDSWIDWIGPVSQFAVFFVTLMLPVGFLLRAFGDQITPDRPALGMAAVVGAWLWLMFPVGLLSFMASGSPFVIVHPAVVRDLFRLPSTLLFYFVTGVGAFGLADLWYLSLFADRPAFILPAAVASAWALLIYGRLIGRLGWLTGELDAPRRKRRAPKARAKPKPDPRPGVEVSDPWAAPAAEAEKPEAVAAEKVPPLPAGGNGTANEAADGSGGYDLLKMAPLVDVRVMPAPQPAAAPAPVPFRVAGEEVDTSRIRIGTADAPAPAAEPAEEPEPEDDEPEPAVRRRPRTDDTPAPPFPLFSGVYTFPWYATSVRALFVLSLGWGALGFCLERLIAAFPS